MPCGSRPPLPRGGQALPARTPTRLRHRPDRTSAQRPSGRRSRRPQMLPNADKRCPCCSKRKRSPDPVRSPPNGRRSLRPSGRDRAARCPGSSAHAPAREQGEQRLRSIRAPRRLDPAVRSRCPRRSGAGPPARDHVLPTWACGRSCDWQNAGARKVPFPSLSRPPSPRPMLHVDALQCRLNLGSPVGVLRTPPRAGQRTSASTSCAARSRALPRHVGPQQRRVLVPLPQRGAKLGQLGEPGRPRDSLALEILRVGRHERIESDMIHDHVALATRRCVAGERQRRYAHPQRDGGSRAARIGKCVQANVDFVVERHVRLPAAA